MGYKHYVFLSYRRYAEWPKWVEDKFVPLLKHYLGEELATDPKIFYDVTSIDTGVAWPKKIGSALARSCIIVPLFSRQYFSSEWCRLELANMLAREKELGFNTADKPERLIVPARIHDGHELPYCIQDIQCARLEKHSNVRMAKDSRREEDLAHEIEKWAPDIAKAIMNVPECSESWNQSTVDSFVKMFEEFETHKPQQMKLPRLG